MLLIEKDSEGIYHFSSKNSITRFDWAVSIAEVFGLDKKLIIKGPKRLIIDRIMYYW